MIQAPGFKDCVLEMTAVADYAKDAEICIPPQTSLKVYQDGKDAGFCNSGQEQKIIKLNKSSIEGLKKGFFAKEYKNLVLYWYHYIEEYISFNETITTAKKRNGKFKFRLKVHYFGWTRKKFDELMKRLNAKTDRNQVLVSLGVIRDIVRERVKEVMPYLLDNFSYANCVVTKENPQELIPLRRHIQEGLEALGLCLGGVDVLP